MRTVAGTGKVLTAGDGHTLYMSQQEVMSGKPLCTSSECTSFWMPLTVAKGKQPSAPSGVSVTLSTVSRPDGSRQVTLNGAPLYTFSFDHTSGQVKGNGFRDSFNGVHFTWYAATTSGAITGGSSSSSSPGGGY